MNKYHIYAYKHYWIDDPNDPIPMPYVKDQRDYVIEAETEKEAIKKAEAEYGSGERVGKDRQYKTHPDGSWTLMGVTKVEVPAKAKSGA